ncbi:MAG: cyclic nucleotide-binding domain-containing protein [Acidimicrobiia bacterium]|nr:cyclic nucleotide-binding domain-containing protein [Acidimicrobiia bacterium]
MADYLAQLASVSLFSGATDAELAQISKVTTEVKLDSGTVLMEQGASAREAFVIVEGSAEVTVDGTSVATLGPGDCVGEVALLDKGPRSATVTATSALTTLVLDPREFKTLLLTVPAIAVKVAMALASRVRECDTKLYG